MLERRLVCVAASLLLVTLLSCSDDETDERRSASAGGSSSSAGGEGGATVGQGGAGGSTTSSGGTGGMGSEHEGVLLYAGPFGEIQAFAPSADSQEVVYSIYVPGVETDDLFAVGVDGSNHRSLLEVGDGEVDGFQVSPHGPFVVYGSDRGGVAVNLSSGAHSVIDFDFAAVSASLPCAFLAGNVHAVCRTATSSYVVPLDGSTATQIGDLPKASPNGQFIASKTSNKLRIIDVTGSELTGIGESVSTYAWKGDSSGVIFSQSNGAAEPGIWVVNNDGTDLTKLTDHIPTAFLVSPDGNWVAYKTSNDNSTVYAMYSLSTSGSGSPIPYDVSNFDHGHSTTGLSLEAITPDYLLYTFGAVTEQYHKNLNAGALDGTGNSTGITNLSGFPTLREAVYYGISVDSTWVIFSVGWDLRAEHLGDASERNLLPSSAYSLREVRVGPMSVVTSAYEDNELRLYRADLAVDAPPSELVGVVRVDEFVLTPNADHLVFLQESMDRTTLSLYALGLR